MRPRKSSRRSGQEPIVPEHMPWVRRLDQEAFTRTVAGARLIVAHAGMGSVITAGQSGRPIVLLPRLRERGEHTTDHQVATANWLRRSPASTSPTGTAISLPESPRPWRRRTASRSSSRRRRRCSSPASGSASCVSGKGILMVKIGVAGLGKMGVSHVAIIHTHPESRWPVSTIPTATSSMCWGSTPACDVPRLRRDAREASSTPWSSPRRRACTRRWCGSALERGLHVFCEKPFCLTGRVRGAGRAAGERGLVTQVGYHYRFVGAFTEVKRLLDAGAIGTVTHVLAEAYGPVVLKPQGLDLAQPASRGRRLPLRLRRPSARSAELVPRRAVGVGGTVLSRVFSRETDDEVFGTLFYPEGTSAQISVNWSDESQRKMTTKITIWGTNGRIYADRQECQVYLRDSADAPRATKPGGTCATPPSSPRRCGSTFAARSTAPSSTHFVERVATADRRLEHLRQRGR